MQCGRWHAAMIGLFVGMLSLSAAQAAAGQTQTPPPPDSGAAQQAPAAPGAAQGRRGQYAGMGRVMGEITAVNGNTLTLKAEDGSTVQVVTTENTRVTKDRGPVKVADLHPGDGLMAVGNLDAGTKTLHAAMMFAEDAAQVKAMRENMGKTYITGRVTAIDLDNAKMTVERPDHQAQVIGFDETTSFKRAVRGGGGNGGAGGSGSGGDGSGGTGRGTGGGGFGGGAGGMAAGGIDRAFSNGESITLADIKVGDTVAGTGSLKGGTFVPVHLVDTPPGQRRQRNGAPEANGAPATPAQTKPAPSPGPGQP